MWLSKLCALLLVLLLTTACGFAPIYQSPKSGEEYNILSEMLASTDVPMMPGRNGQMFHSALMKAINPQGTNLHPQYRLTIQVTEQESALGFQITGFPTRYKLEMFAHYQLVDLKDQRTIDTGTLHVDAPYDVAPSQYATYVSKEASMENVSHELAHTLKQRLIAVFLRYHDKNSNSKH